MNFEILAVKHKFRYPDIIFYQSSKESLLKYRKSLYSEHNTYYFFKKTSLLC